MNAPYRTLSSFGVLSLAGLAHPAPLVKLASLTAFSIATGGRPYIRKKIAQAEEADRETEEFQLQIMKSKLRQIAQENKPINGKFSHALLSHFGGKTYLLTEDALAKFQEKRPTKKVVRLNQSE